jgi:hypothetical protein
VEVLQVRGLLLVPPSWVVAGRSMRVGRDL